MEYWRPLTFEVNGHYDLYREPIVASVAGVNGVGYGLVERLLRSEDGIQSQYFTIQQAGEAYEVLADMIAFERMPLVGLSLDQPRVMGVLNVTPDSFFDGGQHERVSSAVEHALKMVEQGAEIIDIGGESTRPGAEIVAVEDELARVIPVIKELRQKTKALISIDTRKSEVMEAAIEAGAQIINDVSALSFDPNSLAVAARLNVPVILMHSQGTPEVMQNNPDYKHVVLDIYDYLSEAVQKAVAAGIRAENIIVDPGIGFGKSVEHNCQLLKNLSVFHGLGVPMLLGCSRKSFISAVSCGEVASDRLAGSIAGVLMGAGQGVQIFRVHDVAETVQAISVWRCSS